jgi:hypothetical protein
MVNNIMLPPTIENNIEQQSATLNWREGQQQQSMFYNGYKWQAAYRGGQVVSRLATA